MGAGSSVQPLLEIEMELAGKGGAVLLKSNSARNAFLQYLAILSEDDKNSLMSTINLTCCVHVNSIPTRNPILWEFADSLGYKMPIDLMNNNNNKRSERPVLTVGDFWVGMDGTGTNDSIGIEEARDHLFILTMFNIFPKFVQSKQYQNWTDFTFQTDENYANTSKSFEPDILGRESRLAVMLNSIPLNPTPNQRATDEVLCSALRSFDRFELVRGFDDHIDPNEPLGPRSQWLRSLVLTMENLHIPFSMSSARSDRPGFPLIYVNKAFERLTGYDRREIMGQSCKFLQEGPDCKPQAIFKMQYALRTCSPSKSVVTNYRRDGSAFRNLLTMKPVFDRRGHYRFVVALQFECKGEEATSEELRLIADVMSLLPNVF